MTSPSRRDLILTLLAEQGAMTVRDVADMLDSEPHDIGDSLKVYMSRGYVKKGPMVHSQARCGRRFVQTFELGDVKPPGAAPARLPRRPSIEEQRVVVTPAKQADSGIVSSALASRLPIECAVQGWGCGA